MTAEMELKLQELLDKEQIREKLMIYSRLCDRMDLDVADIMFAPDSCCEYGPYFTGTGRELAAWLKASHNGFTATSHQMTNMLINIDGDKATSECGHVGITYNDEESDEVFANYSFSRYLDKWEKRDGQWLIVSRKVLSDIGYFTEITSAKSNYGEYTRDKNDLSYQYYNYKG